MRWVRPNGPEVSATERARHGTGPMRKLRLTAAETTVDLGGPLVRTWTYGGQVPAEPIRLTAGDRLEALLVNHLPVATTVHWHGMELRNDMDGVPILTQRPVPPGAEFAYSYTAPHPGTYWFHPHVDVQQDRGVYGAVIVEDPKEPLSYDREWVVVLDDWVDGVDGSTPDEVMRQLDTMGNLPHTLAGSGRDGGPDRRLLVANSPLLGGHAGDVNYPYYLINGRVPTAPETYLARPGDRIRLRIINASGDTAYRVALGGHRMTITHTDGRAVLHRDTDALLLGMGERYDVLITAGDGVFPLVALAEGKRASALAVLRTAKQGDPPKAGVHPRELDGELVTAYQLRPDESVALPRRAVDRLLRIELTREMPNYRWGVNNKVYDPKFRFPVREGERVRLHIRNETRMWHPVHLHGHCFALPDGGPLKDTVILLPARWIELDFDATNPGLWMLHCHNVYHGVAGMMTVLGYET
jgi:multicopper oxidase